MKTIAERMRTSPLNNIWKVNLRNNTKSKEYGRENRIGINVAEKKVLKSGIRPSVYLANPGPSIDKNVKMLKKLHDEKKGNIICSEVCYFKMIEHEIVPDIVCTIDMQPGIEKFIKEYSSYSKDSTLVASTTTPNEYLRHWKGPVVFYNQTDRHPIKREVMAKITRKTSIFGSLVNNDFVGATMAQVAMKLNPKNVFLAGYDFGADANKKMYCDNFPTKGSHEPEIKIHDKLTGETLYSGKHYVFYKRVFLEHILPHFTVPMYNCTEGGILKEIVCMDLKDTYDMAEDWVDLRKVFYG